MLNKNLKVINISKVLLNHLGIEKKKLFFLTDFYSLINQRIRIYKINQNKATNNDFKNYLNEIFLIKKDILFSINFYNFYGKEVELRLFLNNSDNYYKIITGRVETEIEKFQDTLKIKELEEDFNQIYDKFIELTNIVDEYIYIYDLNEKSVWLSQSLKEELSLDQNLEIINYDVFQSLIYPDDLKSFNIKIKEENKDTVYNLNYRLLINNNYKWVLEKSKVTKINDKTVIISALSFINSRAFVKHSIENLDNLKQEFELKNHIEKLIKNDISFLLASFKITNLKQINNLYGREVANMAISEYIRKINQRFITQSGDIFRLTGSKFQFTITDIRNLGILKEGFLKNNNYLNMNFNYGSYSFSLNVKVGVCIYKKTYTPDDVINNSKNALEVAIDENYSRNIYIYGDINNEKKSM